MVMASFTETRDGEELWEEDEEELVLEVNGVGFFCS